jgi:hypothetical protein
MAGFLECNVALHVAKSPQAGKTSLRRMPDLLLDPPFMVLVFLLVLHLLVLEANADTEPTVDRN